MTEKRETVRLLMKRDRMLKEQAEEFLSYNEYRRQGGGKKGAKMAKKTVTLTAPAWVSNPKAKIAAAVVGAILLAVVAFSVGHNGGYTEGLAKGLDDGNKAGFTRGDKAGFENGYWIGREEGCMWVFDSTGKTYVVGEGNPFTTWYYLMDIGTIYLSRSNCETTGHGSAPYEPSTYVPSATGTN